MKGCLCCPVSVRMVKQWEIFSVGTLKWITLVGNTVQCCCTCRWTGEHTNYHIDCFSPQWGDFHLYFIKCVPTNKGGEEEGFNGIHWEILCLDVRFSTKNRRSVALQCFSLQCKQLRPKPLHSTAHLLTMVPTHIFMYSCVYQNLAGCVAIFSL